MYTHKQINLYICIYKGARLPSATLGWAEVRDAFLRYIYKYRSIGIYTCIHVYIYIYMYVYIYVYIYIHIHIYFIYTCTHIHK